MANPKLNIQTDGEMERGVEYGKKVKLHKELTKKEIDALIQKKREELEKATPA